MLPMQAIRTVLDTNVLVSTLIVPHGKPAQILDQWSKIGLLISDDILAELERVLHYPRIQRRYRDKVSEEAIDAYLDKVRQVGQFVEAQSKAAVVWADPDDDVIIACAVDGNADCIVSGDPHLLQLGSYKLAATRVCGSFRPAHFSLCWKSNWDARPACGRAQTTRKVWRRLWKKGAELYGEVSLESRL